MLFKVSKCSVTHMETRNKMEEYEFGERVLNQSELKRNLGVIMHMSRKSTIQCAEAAKRAKRA